MRGDARTVKDRLDIAEIISGYIKLEKAGANFKGRCPFHNEKTPSFFVSPSRQSYYCFGCGAKGDIFTFVEEMEGVDFREALTSLAEKAGVELEYKQGEGKGENEKLFEALEEATRFFESKLAENPEAKKYLKGRGLGADALKEWRIGYAPAEWRSLYSHMLGRGFEKATIVKAGLAKEGDPSSNREPYDVFRDRIIFPLSDRSGRVIAFSGRALGKDTEPKYLNSPDTPVFTKSEVLYGLDKAKDHIRKKNFAVLVEGQMDLVHSHQAGVGNTVASSGTAFTAGHLSKLKGLSPRIILAFDGDAAGEKAAEKASVLGLSLGFEVKVASMPEGKDPADVANENPEDWKNILRQSVPAVEFFFGKLESRERDPRKLGKEVAHRLLPMIKLVPSSIEQAHFISFLAKRTGVREEMFWEDLKKAKAPDVQNLDLPESLPDSVEEPKRRSRQEEFEEVEALLKETPGDKDLIKHHAELSQRIKLDELDEKIEILRLEVARGVEEAISEIEKLTRKRDEERRKMM